MEPAEKVLMIKTRKPAIPKNMPIIIKNELETAFIVVMLFIPIMKIIKPTRHKTTPTNMLLISNLSPSKCRLGLTKMLGI